MRALGIGALAVVLAACSAATLATVQKDATAIDPKLTAACSFAESVSGNNPTVDFVCAGLEAADRLLERLPRGSAAVVSQAKVTMPGPDASTPPVAVTMVRIRLYLAPTVDAGDAGDAGGQ